MKILQFQVDEQLMHESLSQLANLNRIEIYQCREDLFERLDFEDQNTFLEPALFYFLLKRQSPEPQTPLDQLLWGYMGPTERPDQIPVRTCREGWIALPNYGNFKTAIPQTDLTMIAEAGRPLAFQDASGNTIPFEFFEEEFLPNSSIRIARHQLDIYQGHHGSTLAEPVTQTYEKWAETLKRAYSLLQKASPEYCRLLEATNREVAMFSSPDYNSFAAMYYFGTGFLNVEDQPYDEVFFIDDMAHQCGHVLYNTLTLRQSDYLAIDKDASLKEISGMEWEHRNIYGAFHGLFTYSTIVHCMDQCIEGRLFDERQLKDAIGRIGFYMRKLRFDLDHLGKPEFFTEKGLAYYNMFVEGYREMLQKYSSLPNPKYLGQPYTFRYQLFMENNPAFQQVDYDFLQQVVNA